MNCVILQGHYCNYYLQNVAFARNPQACHFMYHKDIHFKPLHNVLDNLPKKLLTEGIGAEKAGQGYRMF